MVGGRLKALQDKKNVVGWTVLQCFKALAAPVGDTVSLPSTTRLGVFCNFSSRDSKALLWPLPALHKLFDFVI